MRKIIDLGWRRVGGRGAAATLALLALTLIPLAGCSPQSMAQSATATSNAQATQVANPSPTVISPTLSITPTAEAQATLSITATASITATGVVTAPGTPTPLPTPTGEPPDPLSVLNIFQFFSPNDTLVARDPVNLDGTGADEVLYTIAGRQSFITDTTEIRSGIGVLTYDATYRQWIPIWASPPLSGTTSPLPSANRKEAGGYNGGNLLGNGEAVMLARTTTLDGKAHLYLWRWNKEKGEGEPLKMAAPGGAGDADALFDADLDANVADVDDDGIYEVVLDNVAGVQIWKWDGTRFVLRGDS